MTRTLQARILVVIFAILASRGSSYGQANLPIYTDYLVNGFQNWSWAGVNLANTSPVYTNSHSISITDNTNYQALYLEHTPFNTTPYASLDFWINGGASGGQRLQVAGLLNGNSMFNTLGNLTVNPHAGLLFIDFDSGATLQLTGRASIDWSPDRVRKFAGAERVVDFELEQVIDTPMGFPLIAKFRQFSRNNPKA